LQKAKAEEKRILHRKERKQGKQEATRAKQEAHIKSGTITDFKGSWGSGIAMLYIDRKPIPCENTTTVRALDSMFDGVITEGHSVNVEALKGKKIRWCYDDMGLMLGGIAPIEDKE
jgi:hypothetical protein